MLGAPSWGRALVSDLSCAMVAPWRGRALLSDPTFALGAPTWGRALSSDPLQQILISFQWWVKILKPTSLNLTGQVELMGIAGEVVMLE